MSLSDSISKASFQAQEAIYGDPIFFQDAETEEYTIEYKGVFKSTFTLVDSVTQQQFVSDIPTIWVKRPTPIPMAQDLKVRWKDRYFQIKEVHTDVDENAYNLLLHNIQAPEEEA